MIRHGGPDGGPEPLFDFSSNANALGPNPVALEAVRAADLSRYPDPAYTALRTRLGARHGVPAGRVVVGAGASELIHRVVRVFGGPVLTLEPTFGEYAAAARAAGVEHLATYGPEAFLEALPGAGVAFLAQPDNPGGEVHEAAFLDEAARRAREGGARLVVDLAYAPLVEGGVPRPAEALQLHAPNKAHGLVGVRAGYLVLPPGLAAESLVEAAPSWVIGTAAVAFLEAQAGEAARAWVRSTRPRLWLWRSALAASLRALGYEVREGAANFLMARLGAAAAGRLRRRSIRVRPLDDKGLPDWARLSAQPPAAQQALLRAVRESS